MKKIFGMSLVAVLLAFPMIAGAEPVAGEPVIQDAANTMTTYDYTPLIDAEPNGYGYKNADGSDSFNDDELTNGEWKVTWNQYGTVRGTTMCSETTGTGVYVITDSLSSTVGGNCWCKMTGFADKDGTEYDQSSHWVLVFSGSGCTADCANSCSGSVLLDLEMRKPMFGSVQ